MAMRTSYPSELLVVVGAEQSKAREAAREVAFGAGLVAAMFIKAFLV